MLHIPRAGALKTSPGCVWQMLDFAGAPVVYFAKRRSLSDEAARLSSPKSSGTFRRQGEVGPWCTIHRLDRPTMWISGEIVASRQSACVYPEGFRWLLAYRAAALSRGRGTAPLQHPYPLRGCNSDLAHHSITPSLRAGRIRGRGRRRGRERSAF